MSLRERPASLQRDNRKIASRVGLKSSDRIGIGPAMLIFYDSSGEAVTATQT